MNYLKRHEAIRIEDIAYYDEKVKFEGKPLADKIARLYRESTLDPEFRKKYKPRSIKTLGSLDGYTLDDSIYASWKRSYIYRCGPQWFSENKDEFIDLIEFVSSAYSDLNILENLAAVNDAFVKRISGSVSGRRLDFEPSRMNEIEKLQFTADSNITGLDFTEWKKRVDVPDDSVRDLVTYVKQIKIPLNSDRRGVIANFYLHSDMKLYRSRLNSWIFAMNGIPFLNGPLPQKSDSKNKIDRLVQANRDIYKLLLNRCLAIYSDLRLSDLEIQEGPCGIRPRYTEVH